MLTALYNFGVIMADLLEHTTLDNILEHWEALLIDKMMNAKKSTDGTMYPVTEAVNVFIATLNDTTQHFVVAGRNVISLLAETDADVVSHVRSVHFREHQYLDNVFTRCNEFRKMYHLNYVFHFEDLGPTSTS
uniref:PDEase domain-containing protein n=1 Tax=Panagrellus redivivus TaxID=6233 RepID=A0A7E4VIY1_PANRE